MQWVAGLLTGEVAPASPQRHAVTVRGLNPRAAGRAPLQGRQTLKFPCFGRRRRLSMSRGVCGLRPWTVASDIWSLPAQVHGFSLGHEVASKSTNGGMHDAPVGADEIKSKAKTPILTRASHLTRELPLCPSRQGPRPQKKPTGPG